MSRLPSTSLLFAAAAAASVAVAALGEVGAETGGDGGNGGEGSVSVGNPNDGRLLRGARLPDRGTGFYSNPHGPNPDAKYGTDELVEAIAKVGADVHLRAPGATLYVNDLGFEEGGEISHHQSHEAGRDVDFLFFMTNARGKVVRPVGVHFDARGRGQWNGGSAGDPSDDVSVQFDTRRNWLVVKSLVEGRDARVQRIFVSEGLRALMLAFAEKTREADWIVERAGEVMCEPRVPHDDHFHVRLFCTDEDYREGCRDMWPLYPWRRTELARRGILSPELGVRPPTERRRRRPPRRSSPGRLWCP